jgi:glycosyltransferase involved in cell wall biosynthesis
VNSFFDPATRGGDLAIIHLTFEGIQTFGGGVCSVTRGHLDALARLRDRLSAAGLTITPYFLEIAYRDDHPRRDRAYEKHAVESVEAMGGQVKRLVNLSTGGVPKGAWGEADLGTVENWKAASASGAAEALNAARHHDAAVVYCHDSLFSLAPLYMALQAEAFRADVMGVLVAHSTGLTHEMPLPNPERLMVESAGMHWAKVSRRVRIGHISDFMKMHLQRDYGVHADHLVPTGNGVNPFSRAFERRPRGVLEERLRTYGIPTERPLLASWGRPVHYKRFDLVLEAGAHLKDRVHTALVLAEHSSEIAELNTRLGTDATIVSAFDPELVAALSQWPNTLAVAAVAENEPCGLIPMEVRLHARRGGAVMVVSDSGGLAEQVEDGEDGVKLQELTADNLAASIRGLLDAPAPARDRLRENGFTKVLERYTWTSQILRTLSALLPGMETTLGDLSRQTAGEDAGVLRSKDR